MNKKIRLALLVAIIISMGFIRDAVFISINEKTGQGLTAADKYLFILKWALTFVFSFAYLGFTCLTLHFLFRVKKYLWIAVFVYASLFGISFIVAVSGYAFFSFQNVYPFTRTLMGIAQSPIVLLVLVPFFYLNERVIISAKS